MVGCVSVDFVVNDKYAILVNGVNHYSYEFRSKNYTL